MVLVSTLTHCRVRVVMSQQRTKCIGFSLWYNTIMARTGAPVKGACASLSGVTRSEGDLVQGEQCNVESTLVDTPGVCLRCSVSVRGVLLVPAGELCNRCLDDLECLRSVQLEEQFLNNRGGNLVCWLCVGSSEFAGGVQFVQVQDVLPLVYSYSMAQNRPQCKGVCASSSSVTEHYADP